MTMATLCTSILHVLPVMVYGFLMIFKERDLTQNVIESASLYTQAEMANF